MDIFVPPKILLCALRVHFGTSVRRSSGRRSGGRLLANDIVATIFISLFFFPHCFFSPFFSVTTFSHRRSTQIKKLFKQKLLRIPKYLGVDTFPDSVGHFGAPCGHFGFCRRCGVAGGERVPPSPLGWYFSRFCKFCFYRGLDTYMEGLRICVNTSSVKLYKQTFLLNYVISKIIINY